MQKEAILVTLNLKWNESVKNRFPAIGLLTAYSLQLHIYQ